MARDFLHLLNRCLVLALQDEPRSFALSFVLGSLLAGIGWWICQKYANLWNLRFRLTIFHRFLCLATAALTLLSSVLWKIVDLSERATSDAIGIWQKTVNSDDRWQKSVFLETWKRVKALGIEDFSSPEYASGKRVPVTRDASRTEVALTITQASLTHFKGAHPYLSFILGAKGQVSKTVLNDDIRIHFQKNPGEGYINERAVSLVSKQLKTELSEYMARVKPTFRASIVILFIFTQTITFSIIAVSAYRNLKTSC
jgi:hypothetical protein